MRKFFEQNISPHVKHVKLEPQSISFWMDRGNKSIYARSQSQADRICTIEALALLLRECGEREQTCDSLISYVALNNAALNNMPFSKSQQNTPTAALSHLSSISPFVFFLPLTFLALYLLFFKLSN
eukprot:TRINITY_DN6189_c0_g1_i1.p1 TRINITY_DN6189_c0_g1~~TRINITY_DN6189_c0_g1_i1.p1  ORF type:complete len:126 (+),score=28.25 TRINITY_DN6189_c0_g1_i1:529-906(+)